MTDISKEKKSTVEEIRQRFDGEVERFADLNTGQVSTIDARYSLELITEAATRLVPHAINMLDVGCGAGNCTLTMLQKTPGLNCTLLDLSRPMLDRAFERVSSQTAGRVETVQGDIRDVALQENCFDIILASAVLHHLRDDGDWENVFGKLYRLLKPGGCLIVSDLIRQDSEALTEYFRQLYAGYLDRTGGESYRRKVLDYIDREDSPQSITFQMELMKRTGFVNVEALHKNACFGAFCGMKREQAATVSGDETGALLDFDARHVWHPYTSAVSPLPCFMAESAKGVYITLSDGRKVIDGMSSWWAAIHGYNHPYLNEALMKQMEKMSHVMFGGLTHEPAVRLARKLIDMTPADIQHVFFCDSGSVAVEVSMKMAIQYFHARGKPRKCKFATVRSGYHGDTWNAMSVCDPVTGMHSIFGGCLPVQFFADMPAIPFGGVWDESDIDSVKNIIAEHHDEIAAFIIEPVAQGAGGMRFYHPEFLARLRQMCTQYDILLIADEIATGFGRLGTMFACEMAAVTPDIMCVGKALTGGYMTLAATLTTAHVAETVSSESPYVFMHGPTFMGNPLACAVACASLELVTGGCVLEKVGKIEAQLKAELREAWNISSVVDVRVLGAIGVIEVRENVDLKKMQPLFVENGVWIRPFGKLIYTMPPYIITEEELSTLVKGMIKTVLNG
jgi:adenosylmethionine-8-amino-7-oxononanoate aminotransferase